jgi:hydrogenase small subunit
MEPFTSHFPDIPFPGGSRATIDRVGKGVLGLATLGIGTYFLTSFYKGRIHRTFLKSTIKGKKKLTLRKVKNYHTYRPKNSDEE